MSNLRILVTGATGATGKETVRLLLGQGQSVRALVHSHDERSATLEQAGAEIVLGDLRNFDSVRTALEGVRSAYFVFPIQPGILQGTAYFAQAAKDARVEAVVNMSQAPARREAKSHASQDHWVAERIFDWSGCPGRSSSTDIVC